MRSICKGKEKLESCALLMECTLVQPLWKTVQQFFKEIKCDPEIPLLEVYPKE
jgi:hypothetical protein